MLDIFLFFNWCLLQKWSCSILVKIILINMFIVHLLSKSVIFRRNDLWRTSSIFSNKSKDKSIEKSRNIFRLIFSQGGAKIAQGGRKIFRALRARNFCSYFDFFLFLKYLAPPDWNPLSAPVYIVLVCFGAGAGIEVDP